MKFYFRFILILLPFVYGQSMLFSQTIEEKTKPEAEFFEQGNFVDANDPITFPSHNIGAFDTDWRVNGDKLISNTYIPVDSITNGKDDNKWFSDRVNNIKPSPTLVASPLLTSLIRLPTRKLSVPMAHLRPVILMIQPKLRC